MDMSYRVKLRVAQDVGMIDVPVDLGYNTWKEAAAYAVDLVSKAYPQDDVEFYAIEEYKHG